MRLVLIHKTPAKWNRPDTIPSNAESPAFRPKHQASKFAKIEMTNEIKSFFESDIYVQLCLQLCKELGISEFHVVQGYDAEEKRNWLSGDVAGMCEISEYTKYWCLTNPSDALPFFDSDIVITRGNYDHFHCQIQSLKYTSTIRRTWIHYSATALRFPHLKKYQSKIKKQLDNLDGVKLSKLNEHLIGQQIEHNLSIVPIEAQFETIELLIHIVNHLQTLRYAIRKSKYDLILVDDTDSIESYRQIYPNTLVHRFIKPSIARTKDIISERKYALVFCGTTLQETKNHMIFVNFLHHLDSVLDQQISIAVVGDRGNLDAYTKGINSYFENINLDVFNELPRPDLFEIFNNSKTLLLLSGRDANPRVIQEAAVRGVRIILADSISDGYEVISANPLLGAVINTNAQRWFYTRSGNLKFKSSRFFAERVYEEINQSNYPEVVSDISSKLFNLDTTSKELSKIISSLR